MAPHSASRSASTTPQSNGTNPRTPSSASKHRQVSLVNRLVTPSPCAGQAPLPTDHPVEVVARIRDHPDATDKTSVLQVTQNGQIARIRTEQGYRDFGLDGVSLAESEDLPSFYKKYVESRIASVKSGGKCTIMMYGPTGAGKSHTMFGSAKEPGIAYRAIRNILSGSNSSSELEENGCIASPDYLAKPTRVTVTILEIYNEEIFDLLAASNNPSGHWIRPNLARSRLEIMGKKVKNAVSISGTDAEKISKEIAKVEKRRVVKSTLCNERSSRSHCLVMLDVPALGGRLVLVDMAGSENLEQAGAGVDLKLQTGKINQGNIALKRVVEAIANNDSYIPFRDSKLTMLLQDSFEDDESKILMILCASPDPKDIHKTIGTLEYGCKAKCIVSLPSSPAKEKINGADKLDSSVLEARVQAMDIHISKLEAENQSKEKEKEEIYKELQQKEQDLTALQMALKEKESCSMCSDEELRVQMEMRIKECQRVAEDLVAMEKKKLEEKVAEQQREIDRMRSRMREIEKEVDHFLRVVPILSQPPISESKGEDGDIVCKVRNVLESINLAKQHNQLDSTLPSNSELTVHGSVDANGEASAPKGAHCNTNQDVSLSHTHCVQPSDITGHSTPVPSEITGHSTPVDQPVMPQEEFHGDEQAYYGENGWLPIIPEEEESVGEEEMMADGEDVQALPFEPTVENVQGTAKEAVNLGRVSDNEPSHGQVNMDIDDSHSEGGNAGSRLSDVGMPMQDTVTSDARGTKLGGEDKDGPAGRPASLCAASRRSRIENIFLLCGNHREIAAATNIYKNSNEGQCGATPTHLVSSVNGQTASHDGQCRATAATHLVSSINGQMASQSTGVAEECATPSAKTPARSTDKSPARYLSPLIRHPLSENTPPAHGTVQFSTVFTPQLSNSPAVRSLADSLTSASYTVDDANSSPATVTLNSDSFDVYVKWETSKESSGKLIGILNMNRNTTLSELRAELAHRDTNVTSDFTFLMLGDPSGNPVEREVESCLQLTSLPDCHRQRGSKLACLRPHVKSAPCLQAPLNSLENQITWRSPKQVAPLSSCQKSPHGFSSLRPSNEAADCERFHKKANQRLSFPLVSPIKGIRL